MNQPITIIADVSRDPQMCIETMDWFWRQGYEFRSFLPNTTGTCSTYGQAIFQLACETKQVSPPGRR